MISFIEVTGGGIAAAADGAIAKKYGMPRSQKTERAARSAAGEIAEILDGYADLIDENGDTGIAICYSHDCLLIRIFDMGRYIFVFPFEIEDGASVMLAVDELRKYAVKEELPLMIADVPRELLGETVSLFTHCDVVATDPHHESFGVRAMSEGEAVDTVPSVVDGGLMLTALTENDIAEYAALCKCEEVNRYWGYDYRDEVKNPSDRYFYDTAVEELRCGTAVTFAVRWREAFIGEAVIYHFDLSGGAEIGFRLLPKYHGRGLGGRTLRLLAKAAKEIGLSEISGSVMRENTASVRVLSKNMELISEVGDTLTYYADLYPIGE